MKEICALILAAGESRRMGSPKMLLPFGDKTMIERVIDNITDSMVDHIIVVTGAYHGEIEKVLKNSKVTLCYNDNYREGMLSSVICGFGSLPENTEAVLVFPGDQPGIKKDVIDYIIARYRHHKKGIVIPVFLNKRGHPVLIKTKFRNEIEKLDPAEGLRSLSRLFPEEVLEVEIRSDSILNDIDTYEEYLNANNQTI